MEKIENVVVAVLRQNGCAMELMALHLFVCRVFLERLGASKLPVELESGQNLLRHLKQQDPGHEQVQFVEDAGQTSVSLVEKQQPADSKVEAEPASEGQPGHEPAEEPDTEGNETSYVRQLLCSCLLDYVLTSCGANQFSSATPLEDVRSKCIQLLVKAFPEAPPELMSEEGLADLMLMHGSKYMITVSAGRRKMVFRPEDGDRAFHTPTEQQPAPAAAVVHAGLPPTQHSMHDADRDAHDADPLMPAAALATGAAPQTPSPQLRNYPALASEDTATSLDRAVAITTAAAAAVATRSVPVVLPTAKLVAAQAPPRAVKGAGLNSTAANSVRERAVAYLRKHKVFDGPKSMLVERLRQVLLDEQGPSREPSPLESHAVFRLLLESTPAITVWVSKSSDTLRCMLDPDAPAPAPAAAVAAASAAHPPANLSESLLAASSVYKAVHIFLIAQEPTAHSPGAAVRVSTVLRSLRPYSTHTQWHSHPGLHSSSQLLKYLRQDTSLAFVEDPDNRDACAVWIKPQHGSFKVAQKALQVAGGADASDPESGNVGDASNHGSNDSAAVPAPTPVPSGYPQLAANVEVWGPTGSEAVLRAFMAQYGATKMWGFDYKTNAPPSKAHVPTHSRVTLLTLATCRACLLWDVLAGGLPAELSGWMQDGSVQKCRMSAKGSVNVIAKSLAIVPAGFLDLRELFVLSHPDEAVEGSFATFPAIASSVLGVKITGHQTVMKSNWAQRPLQNVQQRYTMQNAWLHAQLLQCLGSALDWDVARMASCCCEARPGLRNPAHASVGL